MIGALRGQLAVKRPTEILVEVGGVGYEALVPISTSEKLPAVGESVTLITHLHVREDALQLFAFATPAERETFRLLIGVSGIGPKLALAVLSGLSVAQFRDAMSTKDTERLRRIPGIGKRTAERLLVELRDRMGLDAIEEGGGGAPAALGCPAAVYNDAVATLVALGYTTQMARRAVEAAVADRGADASVEDLVRGALARV
jgi:Holliday junction DNA helicase RuvA